MKKSVFRFSLTILVFLIGFFSNFILQETIDYFFQQREISRLEPNISVNIFEVSDNELSLILKSENFEGSISEQFFFSFEIPGVVQNISDEIYGISECDISSTPTLWQDPNLSLSVERIFLKCSWISSRGYYSADIKYIPSTIYYNTSVNGKNYTLINYFNLENFPIKEIIWSYKGTSRVQRSCVNLTDLDYVQEDNINLFNKDNDKCYNFLSLRGNDRNYLNFFCSCYKDMACFLEKKYKKSRCEN